MKNKLKDYFYFSRAERNGILVLLCIMALISAFSLIINLNRNDDGVTDVLFEVEVNKFLDSLNSNSQNYSYSPYGSSDESRSAEGKSTYAEKHFTPFPFDPNVADIEDWVRMGFSEKQAKVILKYRDKGGKFYIKEDFKKLFIIDDETYKVFEPFIKIDKHLLPFSKDHAASPRKATSSVSDYAQRPPKSRTIIEINNADSAELIKIYGIGPVFASRIIKYREKLGGFYHKSQLREVYGIDSTRYAQIEDQVVIDTSGVRHIYINTVSLSELRKSPYLDYYLAKKIIDKRIQKGKFTSPLELGEILSSKPEVFKKILPYLVF